MRRIWIEFRHVLTILLMHLVIKVIPKDEHGLALVEATMVWCQRRLRSYGFRI